VCEPLQADRPPYGPRLLDRVRAAIRARHYSYRTEEAYTGWIRRYIFFHGKRHPAEMGKREIEQFLTALAVERKVSASTQSQALAALLFLWFETEDYGANSKPEWLIAVKNAIETLLRARSVPDEA